MKSRFPQGYNSGTGNMNNALKQAQKMQEDMQKAQEELEAKEFSAASGGGMVEAVVSGKKELLSLKLKPEVVDPDDIEMLEDLIIGAINECIRAVEEASEADARNITGGLNFPGLAGLV